ncbi:putative alcohol dehydrogenase [Talaromyces proteolyticus]|uniref:Alcohol dehydrogenase n=1 Tax=Talaromyces proteolyticus TaxID=1131652 RepID=A0AAD4Q458_9EURO|nr:putative alcohol dehydrogenase [Talaromyces proteolyticus]KAH8705819.1 putative alcohol dehydrogenase [Talaromyces proteolyticus]
MPSNRAAYQPGQKAPSLEVQDAPYTSAEADKIVVKNGAVAINPIDWLIQSRGDIMFTHLVYPFVLGSDVAGEVVEVGKNVTRFKVGDRVVGFTRGTDQKINDPAEGGFQLYTVLRPNLVSHIPEKVTYESAAVIPLGLATAAAGLFEDTELALDLPSEPAKPSNGKTLIVWGGSTSVGVNAIQLGVAAGYEVFTTGSPKNHGYLKSLGASQVFDYKSPTVTADMSKALKGKFTAGALSIGQGAAEKCMEILNKSNGNKFIAMASFPVPQKEPQSMIFFRTVIFFVSWMISFKVKGLFRGVKSNLLNAGMITNSGVAKAIFVDYLPKALAAGTFTPAPKTDVVGHGLEHIQNAFNTQKKGVSASKIVVTL